MADHLDAVRKYAADASEETVGKIEKHLGIALRSRDGSLVSCSDQSELDRVRESWCKKKLGATDDAACDEIIGKVCETMSEDRSKNRVAFYYLVADHMGKLGDL
ncbi:MAG: DUF2853 family protein [Pseudomonadota bacterium]